MADSPPKKLGTRFITPSTPSAGAAFLAAGRRRSRSLSSPLVTSSPAFADLGLSAPLQRAIQDAGYVTPTPIQAQAIPLVLAGGDLLAAAQTGTGKTAGFTCRFCID